MKNVAIFLDINGVTGLLGKKLIGIIIAQEHV